MAKSSDENGGGLPCRKGAVTPAVRVYTFKFAELGDAFAFPHATKMAAAHTDATLLFK